MQINMLPGEVFYGGIVAEGMNQPYTNESYTTIDLCENHTPNQMMPALISTAGRWLYHPEGMRVHFDHGTITCSEGTVVGKCDGGLRHAYVDVMKRNFPFHKIKLDERFFTHPVYNTWIEMTFDQKQDKILNYANDIRQNGLPSGVLMIDDGWSDYYGKWKFSKEKFPDPVKMIGELHRRGFSVMLWICPFITPDTVEYRELENADLLVKDEYGKIHIAHWWNGWSAVLDLTKYEAKAWLRHQLDKLQSMGVDGFKFDGGDVDYYPSACPSSGAVQCKAWAAFGEQYAMNEFRVTQGAGGWSLMQRLCDKDHEWGNRGLASLIPNAIVQGLTGHPFLCPDMVGGGEYKNFYDQQNLDTELIVRWAQIACFMPVVQFSAALWNILSREELMCVKQALAWRRRLWNYMQEAIDRSVYFGEPILRPMAYSFSEDENCFCITDQFMIGDRMLVAPLLTKDTLSRQVYLPAGVWNRETEGEKLISHGEYFEIELGFNVGVFTRCS